MHIIAYVYHWDRATLWLLSRKERQMWVDMINEQKKAEANANKEEGTYGEDDFEGETDEVDNDIEDDFPNDDFDD